ncbi:MAG: hypothetical protein QM724_08845 [Flavobacteriales bacterium]
MDHRTSALALAALLLAACSSAPTEEKGKANDLVIGGDDASERSADLYQMPTPNELFHLVRGMAGEGQKRMMNPQTNVDRYVTLPARALNFGVYATDMVYASNFKITSEVVRYYLTCKRLGEQLGLNTVFSDAEYMRLEHNLAHGDSLEVLSNDIYARAYEKMQAENMGATLSLVLAGGWVESMHLVLGHIRKFDPADSLVARVAEQKAGLDHLLKLMDQYKEDPNVAPVRAGFQTLQNIYDQFNVQRSAHQGASPSGRMVLGDDVTITMTSEKYTELNTALEHLRSTIVRGEDGTQTNS